MIYKHLFAGWLLALAGVASAADEEVEKLLSSMRDAYKGAKTARMTVETSLKMVGPDGKPADKEAKATFEATFKGPDKLYLYTDNMFGMEGKIKLVCDGKTITLTSPEDKDEIPFSLEALSGVMPINLESICFWDFKRQLNTGDDGNMRKSSFKLEKEQAWNEKKWTVLEETANEQGVFVKYWIDAKTHFIWRTEVFDLESKQSVMTCELKRLETGIEVDDSLFGG